MELLKFDSYEEYVEAQTSLSLRKARIGLLFTVPKTVETIKAYHPYTTAPAMAICHGVRKGGELTLFREAFGGRWIGTEITPELCNGTDVLHRDFATVDPAWVRAVDIIYSNSLDHALDPLAALTAWLSCLKPEGRLYVEWSPWHNKLGRGNKADCFAADKPEYHILLDRVGVVYAVLDVADNDRFERVVFAVGPRL